MDVETSQLEGYKAETQGIRKGMVKEMSQVQIGTYARRNEDGSFGVSHPIYQETEDREGITVPCPSYEDVGEMFYKIMRNAKLIKRRKEL